MYYTFILYILDFVDLVINNSDFDKFIKFIFIKKW